MPTNNDDAPTLATVAQLEFEHRILNAASRIKRWGIEPAGSYHPPSGRAVALYSLTLVLEKVHEH